MKKILSLAIALIIAQVTFACTASFTYTTISTNNDLLKVNITNTSNYGTIPSGNKAFTIFNFGDGSNEIYIGQTATISHNYSAPGTYTVKVIALIGNDSAAYASTGIIYCTDTVTASVTVAYSACGSAYTFTRTNDSTYVFTATNPAGTPGMTYSWNFGDGSSTGSGAAISHIYHSSTTFSAVLTATSTAGGRLYIY